MTDPTGSSASRRAVLAGALGVGGGIALVAGSEDAALAAAVPQTTLDNLYPRHPRDRRRIHGSAPRPLHRAAHLVVR